MVKTKPIIMPPIERRWAKCPYCGKNAALHDDTANSNGIWHKCKNCGREFELIIKNGEQVTSKLNSTKRAKER